MKKKVIRTLLLLSSILFAACSKTTIYSEFRNIDSLSWNKDSILRYEYEIEDTTSLYTILLCVRHTEIYPYQNMWLFVDDLPKHDTLEFFLADDRGRWLGNGKNGIIEMPVLYEQHYTFPHSGKYSMEVRHGMRDEWLSGISDVGLVIRKEKADNGEK